jgi:hypothetical protein
MSDPVGVFKGFGQAPETVAAAGSTIADAAAVNGPYTYVSGADGTKGAQLPDLNVGDAVLVESNGGNLKLYPHSSTGTINGGSAGAAVTVATTELAICYRYSSTEWKVKIAVAP